MHLSPALQGNDILTLEAVALLECLMRWQDNISGGSVLCMVDNTVLEFALLSRSCGQRPTQSIIRTIFHVALTNDVSIAARWVPSKENVLADALSHYARHETIITAHVRDLLPQHPVATELSPISLPASRSSFPYASLCRQ